MIVVRDQNVVKFISLARLEWTSLLMIQSFSCICLNLDPTFITNIELFSFLSESGKSNIKSHIAPDCALQGWKNFCSGEETFLFLNCSYYMSLGLRFKVERLVKMEGQALFRKNNSWLLLA